ncbi:prolyl oligopeptidase family serine peptidase [Sessilibacter sp. MAH4]
MKSMLLLFLMLFASSSIFAKAIDVSDLFRPSSISKARLSPNGLLVAAITSDKEKYLEVFYPKKQYSQIISKINAETQIYRLGWIDDKTIFFSYRLNNKAPINIGVAKLAEQNDSFSVEVKTIYFKGVVLDLLPREPDYVVAVKIGFEDNFTTIHKLSVENLLNNKFPIDHQVMEPLSGADFYQWHGPSATMFGAKIKENEYQVWSKTREDHRWKNIYSGDKQKTFTPIAALKNDRVAVLSNLITDKVSLGIYNEKTKKIEETLYGHDIYDLEDAEVDSAGAVRFIAYVELGELKTEYFKSKNQVEISSLEESFPGKQVYIHASSEKNNIKLLYVSASDDPGAYYLFDSEKKIAELIKRSNELLDLAEFAQSEARVNVSADGQRVESIYTKPKNNGNGVLLVMPHGGPVGVRDVAHFNIETQFYVNRGFSVLQINFRGSSGFGLDFLNSGRGQFGKIIEQDIMTAVNDLRREYQFEKTCAIGKSYGGYSSVMLTILHPEIFDCAVAMYGVYDLPLLFSSGTLNLVDDYNKKLEFTVGELSEELKINSPVRMVDKIKKPLLVVAGDSDFIAGFEQSNRLAYLLNKYGKNYEYYIYKNTGHGTETYGKSRHEVLMVDRFLREQLHLDFIRDHEIEELKILVDGQSGRMSRNPNDLLRNSYLKLLADLGDNDSRYSYGQYLLGEKESREEGLSYLQAASDAGYAKATYLLAKESEASDINLAINLYHKSENQGEYSANLKLALIYCTSETDLRNLDQCFDYLIEYINESDGSSREVKRKVSSTFLDILDYGNFSSQEQLKITSALNELLQINTTIVQGKITEQGTFGSSGLFTILNRITERTDKVTMANGVNYAVKIRVNKVSSSNSGESALRIKWSQLDSTGAGELNNADLKTWQEFVYLGKERTGILSQGFGSVEASLAGNWKVEIFNLDGSLVASTNFQVLLDDGFIDHQSAL